MTSDPELYSVFAACLVRKLAGEDAQVVSIEQADILKYSRSDCLNTNICIQGDHGEIGVSLIRQQVLEEKDDFITLARIFDQIFPDFRVFDHFSVIGVDIQTLAFKIITGTDQTLYLTISIAGQFSEVEKQNMHWFILSRQELEGILLALPQAAGPDQIFFQVNSLKRRFRLEATGRYQGADWLFRICSEREIPTLDESTGEVVLGALSFPLTSISAFFAKVPLRIRLPESVRALVGGKIPGIVEYQLNW